MDFSAKKSTTNFGHVFLPSIFRSFASKWPNPYVFAFQKGKNVGRKRGLIYIYIYIYIGNGLPHKVGKKCPQNRKMAQKPYFRAIFPIFRLFVLFLGGAVSHIFPIFPISGRRPETYSVAGQRGLNPSVKHAEKCKRKAFPKRLEEP